MGAPTASAHVLDEFIERYELAQHQDGCAELDAFLPDRAHPIYLPVLRELIRLDLEYGWRRGRPSDLRDYQRRYPELFQDAVSVREIAFEDFRQRCLIGQTPSPTEYELRFGIDASDWPTPIDEAATRVRPRGSAPAAEVPDLLGETQEMGLLGGLQQLDPAAAHRIAEAFTQLPDGGTRFLDFHLLAELGRGAFSRVYLARQGGLANRRVALKIAPDLIGESHTLAQLQHTHIVPIYSLHRQGPLQAVCMPYFGAVTLAAVLTRLRMRRPAPSRAEDLTVVLAECRARRPAAGSASQLARYLGSGSYVEAVLGVGACLADGLAHAHERGILHRDLKPANVLLTDEGVPMLLDFNLSEDTKQPHTTSAGSMGGTLPYMAPEHLEAFAGKPRTLDGRADVYALGVILFELLTLRHPFDLLRGPVEEILPSMLAQRQGAPPRLRTICPAIPAAVESLVRHCLEPDPNRRYASARELQEDLERQRNNEPLRHIPEPSLRERLRKWGRRHPRLISSGSVAAMAGVGLLLLALLLMVRNQKLTRLEAAQAAEQLRSEVRTVQFLLLDNRAGSSGPLDEGLARCQQLLDQFDIRGNPRWQDRAFFRALTPEQRAQLLGEIGDLLLLGSRVLLLQAAHPARASEREQFLQDALVLNERAEQCHPVGQAPRAVWRQRIELLRAQGRFEEARECAAQLPEGPATTARDLAAEAAEISFNGRPDEALPLLLEAVRSDPRDLWAWFDLGLCQEGLGHDAEAAACFSTCIALAPDFWPLAYKRGIVHLRRREFSLACADLDRVVEAQPEMVEARINRALALVGAGRSSDAERDLTAALEREQPPTRLFFLRARVREQQGDLEGAARDRAEGLRRQPGDEASWLARGTARLAADPAGALADFDQALVLNPRSLPALQNRAHVLAECLEQPRSAIETLDRILQLHPANLPARASRAVLLARLAERSAAHRDAEACLARDTQPETLYQIAGVYALTSILHSDDRWDALHCLGLALRRGYGLDLIDRDRDLDPIRRLPEFQQLVDQARRVRARPENPSARP